MKFIAKSYESCFLLILFLLSAFFFTFPGESEAIPAFARQTGQSCSSCHYQHFPTLNSFGRAFKAGGYSMVGDQKLVEDEDVSLPASLNLALLGTLQYVDGETDTEVGYPAALSLYAGGRIGRESGFLIELPFENAETEVVDSTGATEEFKTGSALANYGSMKWNYVTDVKGINVGLNVYSSEGTGPAYGYELLSTGAMGMSVAVGGVNAMGAIGLHMEHGATLMSNFSRSKATGGMAGSATGYGVSAQTDNWFVYASQYYNKKMIEHTTDPRFANYLRAAWTPSFGGFDLGMGLQIYTGKTKTATDAAQDAKAITFDFQAQGDVAGMPCGIYATYAEAPKSSSSTTNWYNGSTQGDNSAYSILGEFGVMEKLAVSLGYVNATYYGSIGEEKGTSTVVGVNYLIAANKRLEVKYVDIGGDFNNQSTAGTLQIGF